ncbi:SUN domain-containing ossification factor [Anopheles nili]|uniref:SUN domain-containing ossification factor n=1 Tax=Anopheles nili TaxID=185578 RepID=UPI00237C01AF|nr:SUN domain-containing ossification factor [Anopheles nili]
MKPSLCYAYCTLLLVLLVSSCTLFIIVASETLKPSSDLQRHGAESRQPNGANVVQHSVDENPASSNEAEGIKLLHRNEQTPDSKGEPGHVRVQNTATESPNRKLSRVHAGFPGGQRHGVKPLKKPAHGGVGKNSLKKDILTERPTVQHDEPPDLKDVIFLETISKNVGVTNSGLQNIPGPPSIITLVDNQHNELNNIESKLEENLEATLKNLSHNNPHTVQPTVPLHNNDQTQEQHHHQPLLADGIVTAEEEHSNGTLDMEGVEVPDSRTGEPEQPALIMAPTDDGGLAASRTLLETTEVPSVNEVTGDGDRVAGSGSPEASPTGMPLRPLEMNLTEENPMPVFSEWAQKQMAEAEKKLGEVVNASAMKKGTKPTGGKANGGVMKPREKNYAAPECGAKIIASNPEAQSTGSVLTAPKDEYLLNPCTSKIWFVVELCEPVQAERIELANFELFSSSPKEFTVSVSNRFPTRDWANVGQFTAKDERDVQSFQLHPHLFGKFVRVEILSHYNQEHFCPVSLFRVYGTSEFEAFETDNTPMPLEDDDEDDVLVLSDGSVLPGKEHKDVLLSDRKRIVESGKEPFETTILPSKSGEKDLQTDKEDDVGVDTKDARRSGKNPNNILKSAGEVVMNMVKKAAEALSKSGNDSNNSSVDGTNERATTKGGDNIAITGVPTWGEVQEVAAPSSCFTLAYTIRCVNCTDHFRAQLESMMNCKHNLLTSLLGVPRIERSFDSAQHFLCANVLGFNLPRSTKQGDGEGDAPPSICLNMRYSLLNLLPDRLVAGLCNVVAFDLKLLSTISLVPKEVESNEPVAGETDQVVPVVNQKSTATDTQHDLQENSDPLSGKPFVDGETSASIPTQTNEKGRELEQLEETEHEPAAKQDDLEVVKEQDGTAAVREDVNMFNIATESPQPTAMEADVVAVSSTGQPREQEQQQDYKEKEDLGNQHWESIDEGALVAGGHHHSDGTIAVGDGSGPSGGAETTTGHAPAYSAGTLQTGPQKGQPESVFLRLSNRIKALERNMSLSGQYLEELSRRYRKQVEELQHSYAKTLHEIDDQNRRMRESETTVREMNDQLRQDLMMFQDMVIIWRNIALVVLFAVVLLLAILLVLMRTILGSVNRPPNGWVASQQPAPLPQSVIDRELAQVGSDAKPIRGRMLRRKSIDGMPTGGTSVDVTGGSVGSVSGVIIGTGDPSTVASGMSPARLRKKRPSEEALNISGTYVNLLIEDEATQQQFTTVPVSTPQHLEKKKSKQKHRKVSAPSMMIMATAATSTPLAGGGNSWHEPARRSVSMNESQDHRRMAVNGSVDHQRSSGNDTSGRIDELPLLEDNDEFIIPTASDLSYDEFMPGSNPSSVEPGLIVSSDIDRIMDGTPDSNGTGGPVISHSSTVEETADREQEKKHTTKSSRRLSSPAFFKSSLLRSSLGSAKRSSKKSAKTSSSSSGSNTSGNSSSSNSSNISSNNSGLVKVMPESSHSNSGGDAWTNEKPRNNQENFYRWWSEQSKVLSSSPSSSQEVSLPSDVKQRQRIEKAKSASPDGPKGPREGQEPVKLSVSFNGDFPANGVTGSGNGLDRKSSRGSIRRLFRKVF